MPKLQEDSFGDYKGREALQAKLRVLIMGLRDAQTAWQKADMFRKSTEPLDEVTLKEQLKQDLLEDFYIIEMVKLKGLFKPGKN
ncbi:MAG TPA: hypothetical protein VHO03_17090 [Ignavibacteriales bacterium]|nr:hypothetical protein [Ignavibacteriales bacterium]